MPHPDLTISKHSGSKQSTLTTADPPSCQNLPIQHLKLPSRELLSRRFHVILGKGGVGKSTVAMTLGLTFAQQGLRTLICEVDDREMMSHAFNVAPSRAEIRQLRSNLFAVCIDTQSALSEYGALKLKVKALSKLLTENPLTRALVSIVPGVADLIALGKAFNHERERQPQAPNKYQWDRIIVDAPSTGHGLTFLKLPLVIKDVVPSGNMRKEADDMWTLLSDPQRCCLHLVSTAEEMPIQESRDLWTSLQNEMGLSAQSLWINKLSNALVSEASWIQILEYYQQQVQDHQTPSWLYKLFEQKQSLYDQQIQQINRLDGIKSERSFLPYFPTQTPNELRESIAYALEALNNQDRESHV